MPATPQKRSRSSPGMTSQLLHRLCQFPEPDFLQLKRELAAHMADPGNRIASQDSAPQEWLDTFIDSGIGVRYWGAGKSRKWDLSTNQEQIRAFMREMVRYTNTVLKNRARRPKTHTSPDTDPPPAKRLRAAVDLEQPGVIIIDLEFEPDRPPPPPPLAGTTPRKKTKQQQRGFVLESTLAGSPAGSIKLIYSTDVPTLAHLVEQVRKKHHLDSDHEVLKISVKIGERCLNVDLEERRDWTHIAGVIAASGVTPELVVWTS